MKVGTFGRWTIQFDSVVTAQYYSLRQPGPGCNCSSCRNFMMALDKAFPASFLSNSKILGIDISKPIEVCSFGCQSGLHIMNGWFHLVGQIVSGNDVWKENPGKCYSGDFEIVNETFEFGFSKRVPEQIYCFNDSPLIAIEFITRIPWLLSEEEPS